MDVPAFEPPLGAAPQEIHGESWFDDVALEEIGPDPTTTLAGITEMIRQRDAGAGGLEGENDADAALADPADSGEVDVVLEVGVTPSALLFDTTELRVGAGQRVRIVFNNTDHMEHNLVVIMPGSFAVICTIPGHWRSMRGTLIVEPAS